MSYQATEWALKYAPIPPDERGKPSASSCTLVLVALAYPADPDGCNAFPAVDTIRAWTHLSERTIRATLDRLEAAGLIRPGNANHRVLRQFRKDRRPKIWNLALHRRRADAVESEEDEVQPLHPVEVNEVQSVHPVNGNGVQSRPHGVQPLPERGAATAPKESLNSPSQVQEQQRASTREDEALELVMAWRTNHKPPYGRDTYRRMSEKVAEMLREDADPDFIKAALQLWDQREDAKSPGLLPHLYQDAVKTSRGATRPAAGRGAKVEGWLALGAQTTTTQGITEPRPFGVIEGGRTA